MTSIKDIQDKQKTIDMLLKLGSLASEPANQWVLEPLHHDDNCNVGFVHIEKKAYGACDAHIHAECKEYLICTKGAFMLTINGSDVRTISAGECGVVNKGEIHYSKPLMDDTQMVYICVPADKDMSLLEEQLRRNNDE